MQALTLFNQNFAVAESLLQLYQLFHGMKKADIKEDLRLAVCSFWGAPENTALHPAINDRIFVLAKATTPIPESLTMDGGSDYLLREAVVVACTALEAFFWDALRENVLTVVRARKSGADESLTSLKFTLGDYISIQQYADPDDRLKQIILKNFERGMLYDMNSIDKIVQVLTIKHFWEKIEKITDEKTANFRKHIGELINRRNQIAHRADRPDEGDKADSLGLRPISMAWTNLRVQAAKTLVTASASIIQRTIEGLEKEIEAAKEQEAATKVLKELSKEIKNP
jgi:predicted DNA-binding ribbon-helix-helix protein